MKKLFLFLLLAVNFGLAFAGNLVHISLKNADDVNMYHQTKGLSINYYCNDFIIATFDGEIKADYSVIDSNAWTDDFGYYLLWVDSAQMGDYLADYKGSGEIIYHTDNFCIAKVANNITPEFEKVTYGGIVRIFNQQVIPTAKKDNSFYSYRGVTNDPLIEELIAMINQDSLQAYVQHLEDYGTRVYSSNQCVEAQTWIKSHFDRYGYDTELQQVNSYISKNIIAIKVGTKYPDEYVVCGSHFDSYAYSGQAPGADDNATGTAGQMEIARILSNYSFDRTIIICTFTAEEIGLYGSAAYASRCAQQGMNILGYFNIDMSGYLQQGSQIHTSVIHPNSATELYNFYHTTCEMYVPELTVQEGSLSGGDSDHTSFNQNGYMGIYPFEDANNYSPYIHSSNDLIGPSVNNFEQVKVFTKACMANVLRMANRRGWPQNLTADVSETTVTLNWTLMPDEITEYRIYRDGVQIGTTGGNINTYIDNTVVSQTLYTYYITAIFAEDGTESDHSNSVTAYPMGVMTLPFYEPWDNFTSMPPYWSFEQVSGSVQWEHTTEGTPAPFTSPYHARMYSNNTSICKLVSPKFDMSGASDVTLTFQHSQRVWGSDQDELRVYYRTSATSAWVLLEEYTSNVSSWTLRTIELPNLSSEYYIAFEGKTDWGYGVQIDEITINGTLVPPTTATLAGNMMMYENGNVVPASPNAIVFVGDDPSNPLYSAAVNANGSYSIQSIPPGTYTVGAALNNGDGCAFISENVVLELGNNVFSHTFECPYIEAESYTVNNSVMPEQLPYTDSVNIVNTGYGDCSYNAAVEYVGGNGSWLQVEYDGHLSGHDDVDKLYVILDPSKAPIETYEANIIVTPDFEYEEPLTINVVFEVIVGINEISDDLSIYPNPAENVLTVKGTFENLSVISVEGKNLLNVIKSQTTEEITDVNVSELPAGVYFIKIKVSEKQIVIKKFVKQ